jgi:hypothetical protein
MSLYAPLRRLIGLSLLPRARAGAGNGRCRNVGVKPDRNAATLPRQTVALICDPLRRCLPSHSTTIPLGIRAAWK